MKKIIYRLVFFIAVTMIFSCSQKEIKIPADVIPRDTMVKILSDVQMVEAIIQLRNLSVTDSTRALAYGNYKYVFQKHNVSYDSFLKSYEFYRANPELMDEMYKDMITDISAKQANFHPKDTIFKIPPPEPISQKKDSATIKRLGKQRLKGISK